MNSRRFSRRKALRTLSRVACAAPGLHVAGSIPAMAAGKSPAADTFHPQFLDSEQFELVFMLSEMIIPKDDHSPGAKAAKVGEYIDEMLTVSGGAVQQLWKNGLAAMNELAQKAYAKAFVACSEGDRIVLLTRLCTNEQQARTMGEKFFVAMKEATIEGYYNSAIGIHQDLQYQGNTALTSFPGCERQH